MRAAGQRVGLSGATQRRVDRTTTHRHGRFRTPGGGPPLGSEWLLRITGPGKNTTLVKFTIDLGCAAEPVIEITPGNSGR